MQFLMLSTPGIRPIKRPDQALRFPAAHNAETHERRRQVRWPSRWQVDEARSAAPARVVSPRAIGGEAHDQVIQQNLSAVFHRQPRKPIRASALAHVTAQADQDIGIVDEPVNSHASAKPARPSTEPASTSEGGKQA
jgi:hypothetical protein